MKSMKRPAAMFGQSSRRQRGFQCEIEGYVCKDKCFEEKNRCRVCRQGRLTRQNEAWNASTDFDMWLERRAELEKSIVEQNYKQNIGKTVEIVKVC